MPDTKPETTKPAAKVPTPRVKSATPKVARSSSLSAPVFSLLGRSAGTLPLPKEVFGAEVNEKLLAQAMRVYLNNQKAHYSNTKTRGEVQGSTAKMGPQKGSGRARHGSKRAPIYRGGGIALGPKSRKVELELPLKMKRAALISALSQKVKSSEIGLVTGLDKASGKTEQSSRLRTKEIAEFLKAINKKNALFVTGDKNDNAARAVKNLQKVDLLSAEQLNVFEVVRHQSLILTKEAVEKLNSKLGKGRSD